MATVASLFIVTKPAPAGLVLCERLVQAGWPTLFLPAFTLEVAPDPELVARTLANLAQFDLAVFVSPNAVRAVSKEMIAAWPAPTAIGAVGDATRCAVETELTGAASAALIAPAPGDDSGSEGFWKAWTAHKRKARRVLILRAQSGREWLAERFTSEAAVVETLAVYARRDCVLDAAQRRTIEAAIARSNVARVLYSSSEAIEALDRQLAEIAGAHAWLRQGTALATHPRIAQRLHALGFSAALVVPSADDALLAKLESLRIEP